MYNLRKTIFSTLNIKQNVFITRKIRNSSKKYHIIPNTVVFKLIFRIFDNEKIIGTKPKNQLKIGVGINKN
jgi:hypothetical protein